MAHDSPDIDRIETARRLYIKYEGKQHEQIEREMRSLGYHNFHRRILNSRFERGHHRPGWIERFGFGGAELQEVPELQEVSDSYRFADESANSATSCNSETTCNSETPVSDFDHFQAWLKDVSPGMTWDWDHQVYIYKRLKKVSDGICKRLMIFLPPRHGKSELVTVRYTAWRMKQDPKMNVILGSYNQRLANRFSRKIKKVLMDDFALTAETQRSGEDEENLPQINADNADKNPYSDPRHLRQSAAKTLPQRPGASAVNPASVFPFVSNRPKNTESEWETAVGGGLRAVGVGSGVTGFGANLIVIDDPVKSRAEAESQKMREKVWHWFNDDIYTRLEPNGSIVLIQTRWHEDDLAGRLLREPVPEGGEKWEVVNLPALAEEGEKGRKGEGEMKKTEKEEELLPQINADSADKAKKASKAEEYLSASDPRHLRSSAAKTLPPRLSVSAVKNSADPLDREPGQALCPERYNELYFKNLREKIGSYAFASLYQQHPSPAEGGMFRRKWFEQNIIPAAPAGLRWKRGTDPGVSAGEKADYSASVRVAIDRSGNMYIADMFRRQVEYPELRRFIVDCLKNERHTEHAIELAGHGPAIHQDLIKNGEAQGRAFRGIKINDPKMARALPWLALAEAGKVYLIRGPWNEEFLNETASFPMGTHDDQIDAVSLAFGLATAKSKKSWGF